MTLLTAVAVTPAAAVIAQTSASGADGRLNKAVAIVMSNTLQSVLNDLRGQGLEIDQAEVGRYIASILGGDNPGMTTPEANAVLDGELALHTKPAPAALTPESQSKYILDIVKSNPDAIVRPSGVIFMTINEGEGDSPAADERVSVKYKATLSNGQVIDDTGDETVVFNLKSEIPGLADALKAMQRGGTYRVVIPPEQAYGEEGIPGIIPGNAVLDFTIRLMDILPPNGQNP